MRQDSIDASFLLNDSKVTALKKDLVKKQFVMKIFEFFPKLDLLRVQILNKRFYVGITPNWLHKIVITKPMLTSLSLFGSQFTAIKSPGTGGLFG